MIELNSETRSKLLDVFRHGFRLYDDYCSCPYICGTIENEYWWVGFAFAEEIAQAVLLEK